MRAQLESTLGLHNLSFYLVINHFRVFNTGFINKIGKLLLGLLILNMFIT
jgi:hypothetical protein